MLRPTSATWILLVAVLVALGLSVGGARAKSLRNGASGQPASNTMYGDPQDQHILIGVTTSAKAFPTRVASATSTWAHPSRLPSSVRVVFFVGKQDNFTRDQLARIASVPVENVQFTDEPDEEYPPVHKNTAMLYRMNEIGKQERAYQWFMKVDDDTLVDIYELQIFLSHQSPNGLQYLGQRGYGRPSDRSQLQLQKPFCMGGPGYVMSRGTLERLAPELKQCVHDEEMTHNQDASEHVTDHEWHSDVVIGVCVHRAVNIGCDDGSTTPIRGSGQNYFFQNYPAGRHQSDSDISAAWPSDAALRSSVVTMHPLKLRKYVVEEYQRMERDLKQNK